MHLVVMLIVVIFCVRIKFDNPVGFGYYFYTKINMKNTLSQFADIISGYSFRRAIPVNKDGFYKVLQVGDIDDIYIDSAYIKTTADIDSPPTSAIIQQGDILLAMRGTESSGLKVAMVIGITECLGPFFRGCIR